MKTIIYRVKSDNFSGYMTDSAYSYLRLEMSSGDFGSHTAREVKLTSVRGKITHYYQDVGYEDITAANVRKWHEVPAVEADMPDNIVSLVDARSKYIKPAVADTVANNSGYNSETVKYERKLHNAKVIAGLKGNKGRGVS